MCFLPLAASRATDGSSGVATGRGLKPPTTVDPMKPPRVPPNFFAMVDLRRTGWRLKINLQPLNSGVGEHVCADVAVLTGLWRGSGHLDQTLSYWFKHSGTYLFCSGLTGVRVSGRWWCI